MIDLKDYGFTDYYSIEEEFTFPVSSTKVTEEDIIYARVSAVHRELYKVITKHGEVSAKLKGTFYNQAVVAEDFPAVGDFVVIKYNTMGDSQILKVCRRKSKFSRPDYSGHAAGYVKTIREQVVAANFDYVFIMASLNYDFNINRILRYITVTWESGGSPVVLLSKADLVEDYSKQLKLIQEQAIGVDVYVISSIEGLGLNQLDDYLKPKKTLVFLGSSGVGKSTLVNALAGEELMKVNDIREDDSRGRHTTTHRQLIRLNNGVLIIDTPGMRELGMWDIGEGLGEAFSDIEELFANCRFSNCTHSSEPGCAVHTAMEDGTLEKSRWKNYLHIKSEAKFTEEKSTYMKNKKDFMKKISKDAKAKSTNGGKR
ncbi:MAG TPA: ribosome small subunit-dependent GTPase A [Mobilitalea sp.]|nr:ribosome small subunit-dependent GTPase A [Mobilitalea sp.]